MISKILCRLSLPYLFFFGLILLSLRVNGQNNCIQYDIIGSDAPKGDCIWVPVRLYNFDSVLACQFGIAYDPRIIVPVGKWANKNLNGLDTSANNIYFDSLNKLVRVLWSNPNANGTNTSFKNGDTIIMVKFKLIGEPGACTPVYLLGGPPVYTEFVNPIGDPYCIEELNKQDNIICITDPVDLCVIASSCGTVTNSGSITIKAFGGSPPYTVLRVNPAGPPDVLLNKGDSKTYYNLFPGNHQIRVTDATGKDTLLDIVVTFSNPISIMRTSIRQPTCWNTSDGSISINASGGSGPLTIGWRPLDIYGYTTVNKLPVGTYTVTVSDTAGCVANEDFVLFADTLHPNVRVLKDATCFDDGIVLARATGGSPYPTNRYDFIWSQNPAANNTDTISLNPRMSGKQFVIIRDSRGCKDTVFFEVKYSGQLKDSIVIDSIPCFDSTGSFQAFISSAGTLNTPLSFRLTDIGGNSVLGGTNGVDNYRSPKLKAGTYYLNSTDNSGCLRRDTIVMIQPSRLEIIDLQLDTTETCLPGNDAFLCVRGFGGTPTYEFKWSNQMSGGCINNLSSGLYSVTVCDFKGCTATKSFTITKPIGPVIDSFILVQPKCVADKNGSVEVRYTASGATPTFQWNVPGSTARLNNLGVGKYIVTITDQNGCRTIDSVTLSSSGNTFRISGFTVTNPRCHGLFDGFLAVSVENFTNPVIYTWDNGAQSSINTNLKAGTYCVNIRDAGTCPAIDTCFVLTDPPKIDIQLSNVSATSCSSVGTCDATAVVLASGRDSTYQIVWSSGELGLTRSDTAQMLCAGNQFVIVRNGNICEDTLLFNVPSAIPIQIDSSQLSITPPRCYESNDGMIRIMAKGGTAPYQYQWVNPMVNSPVISNLGDGTYHVNIIDSKNCIHRDSVRLRQPDSIRVDIILGSTLDVSCSGRNDGRITTAWTGGNRGKGIFQWTPGIGTDSVATNLAPGRYVLQVTDIKGCTGTNEYTILEPPPIRFQMTSIDTPRCNEDRILFSILSVTGGSGPAYQWTINNGAPNAVGASVPLFSGTYAIRIYDKNNCFVDTIIMISNPTNSLSLDFGRDFDTIQLGDSIFLDGKLSASTVIKSIVWNPVNTVHSPNSASSYVSPNRNTMYELIVTDINGCQVSDKITIIVRSTRQFYVPNIFSPNGDNINDFFSLHVGQGVKAIKSVQIFDRWGNRVYQLENPVIDSPIINTWNGRAGNTGDFLNPAVFIYLVEVELQDGTKVMYRGGLTLIR
jgi:gliding motility-associated-like protein